MKNIFKVLLFLVATTQSITAQITPSPGGFNDDVNDVPLNTNVSILFIAALFVIAFALYKTNKIQRA